MNISNSAFWSSSKVKYFSHVHILPGSQVNRLVGNLQLESSRIKSVE